MFTLGWMRATTWVVLRWGPLLAVCFIVSACASQSVEDLGENRFRIGCSGGHHDWSRCRSGARKACGDDYVVVSQVSDESSSGVGVNDWRHRGSEVTRSMTVECAAGDKG
jgi:hypothetical protein